MKEGRIGLGIWNQHSCIPLSLWWQAKQTPLSLFSELAGAKRPGFPVGSPTLRCLLSPPQCNGEVFLGSWWHGGQFWMQLISAYLPPFICKLSLPPHLSAWTLRIPPPHPSWFCRAPSQPTVLLSSGYPDPQLALMNHQQPPALRLCPDNPPLGILIILPEGPQRSK